MAGVVVAEGVAAAEFDPTGGVQSLGLEASSLPGTLLMVR